MELEGWKEGAEEGEILKGKEERDEKEWIFCVLHTTYYCIVQDFWDTDQIRYMFVSDFLLV